MREILSRALDSFLASDLELLVRDANERTIAHKIAEHLQPLVPDADVDCEYNRDENDIKRLRSMGFNGRIVLPDIIVHVRGTSDNRLVVELKKHTSSAAEDEGDRRKLRAFVTELGYGHAAFLKVRTGDNPGVESLEWVED